MEPASKTPALSKLNELYKLYKLYKLLELHDQSYRLLEI